MLVALAGGVGAARFLDGVVNIVSPSDLLVVVNTGDDDEFHGLHVSPDLDSITYMLAGASDRERGWGLASETFGFLDAMKRYRAPTWFQLGDRDLATHVYRTVRLSQGATLTEVTAEITAAWGLECRLVPMSDDPVRTRIQSVAQGASIDLAMQQWFVRDRCEPPVEGVHFDGAESARPGPHVLDAIANAEAVLVCPSNPVISIGPILSVGDIRHELRRRREHVVAISPIIAGAPVRGPADRLMRGLGLEVSCVGVAQAYADICATLVIDARDAERARDVEALGVRAVVADTLMQRPEIAASLARRALDAVA